ncbi:SBDS domain-containing protein [Mycena venus]|uniref:SBDS domain-containing protein n=1 Tax=Mycena venus TaxID=2733690 RepID=A0A8H6Y5Y3_9AGAR|nr:SBDS domain-containing protein [Mycena venus]
MVNKTSKVIYKPDSQSTEEFTCIVNSEEYQKWKDGDTSIPLAQVVDSFQVFVSTQGAQGVLGKPSHQQLDSVFDSHKDEDVVTKILKEGREQVTDGVASSTFTGTNASRGNNDTRGGRQ